MQWQDLKGADITCSLAHGTTTDRAARQDTARGDDGGATGASEEARCPCDADAGEDGANASANDRRKQASRETNDKSTTCVLLLAE